MVISVAADQHVVAAGAHQEVIAGTAINRVFPVISKKGILRVVAGYVEIL